MNNRRIDRHIIMPTESSDASAVSAHRAFAYSACAPGAGQVYAGFRFRGYALLALFTGLAGWAIWLLATWVASAADSLFGRMYDMGTPAIAHLPVVSIAAAFLSLFLIWYWGLFSAVDAAVRQRRGHGRPAEASVAWALAMSWLCPGAGQVYTGRRGFGLILFAGYILGILLMAPAYKNLFNGLSGIVAAGGPDLGNVQQIVRQVHILLRKVDFSVGALLQHAVKWYAIASTLEALRQGPLRHDGRWSKRSPGYGLALAGIGWLCPGAGQLLQGRQRAGWLFLAGYVTATLAIGLSADRQIICVPTAERLEWLRVIIQWVAVLEAPLAMKSPVGPPSSGGA